MPFTAFGPFRLDLDTGELFRDGAPVALPPNATAVLVALVSRPGRLVTHEELWDAAWNDTVVSFDQSLYGSIRQIRRALDDDARNPRYIETVPRRGYRFRHAVASSSSPRTGKPGGRRPAVRACASSLLRNSGAFAIERGFDLIAPAIRRHIRCDTSRIDGAIRAEDRRFRTVGVSQQTAMGAVAALAVVIGGVLLHGPARTPHVVERVVVGEFRIDGFPVSTGGIDERLRESVRASFAACGIDDDRAAPNYVLTGIIEPADDGATLRASLVRISDGVTVWVGQYNPFCAEVDGDPVPLIGRLVARTVRAQIAPERI